MKTVQQALGQWGEQLAVDWLVKNGYIIIAQNYTAPSGEIDIIARINAVLCFIEVKTRTGPSVGSAERSVGFVKQKHWARAAHYYCQEHKIALFNTSIRFEQISIYYSKKDKKVLFTKYLLPFGVAIGSRLIC